MLLNIPHPNYHNLSYMYISFYMYHVSAFLNHIIATVIFLMLYYRQIHPPMYLLYLNHPIVPLYLLLFSSVLISVSSYLHLFQILYVFHLLYIRLLLTHYFLYLLSDSLSVSPSHIHSNLYYPPSDIHYINDINKFLLNHRYVPVYVVFLLFPFYILNQCLLIMDPHLQAVSLLNIHSYSYLIYPSHIFLKMSHIPHPV